jgi:hypothetical protein
MQVPRFKARWFDLPAIAQSPVKPKFAARKVREPKLCFNSTTAGPNKLDANTRLGNAEHARLEHRHPLAC